MKSIQFIVFAIALPALVTSVAAQDKGQLSGKEATTRTIAARTITLSGNDIEIGSDEFYVLKGNFITKGGFPFHRSLPLTIGSMDWSSSVCYIIKQEIVTRPLAEEYRVTPSTFSKFKSGLIKPGFWKRPKLVVDNATKNAFDISVDSLQTISLPPLNHMVICFFDTGVHEISLSRENRKELIRLSILDKGETDGVFQLYNIGRANRYSAYGAKYASPYDPLAK